MGNFHKGPHFTNQDQIVEGCEFFGFKSREWYIRGIEPLADDDGLITEFERSI